MKVYVGRAFTPLLSPNHWSITNWPVDPLLLLISIHMHMNILMRVRTALRQHVPAPGRPSTIAACMHAPTINIRWPIDPDACSVQQIYAGPDRNFRKRVFGELCFVFSSPPVLGR